MLSTSYLQFILNFHYFYFSCSYVITCSLLFIPLFQKLYLCEIVLSINLNMTVEGSKRRSYFLSLVLTKCLTMNLLLRISAKSMGFCEKESKRVDLAKTSNFLYIYHVLGFWPNFEQKPAKSITFGEKPPKRLDLAKTRHFLCKLPCFRVLTQFLEKSCKKHGIF